MTMAKKKLTPEQRAERAAFDRQSAATLRRLRELVDKGWTDLERRGIAKRPA
jgi:hypothetical protein